MVFIVVQVFLVHILMMILKKNKIYGLLIGMLINHLLKVNEVFCNILRKEKLMEFLDMLILSMKILIMKILLKKDIIMAIK